MQKVNDFRMREISISSDDDTMKVVRTRTSRGACHISITLIGKDGATTFHFSNGPDGNIDYEEKARELSKMLDKIADDPCNLPPVDPQM